MVAYKKLILFLLISSFLYSVWGQTYYSRNTGSGGNWDVGGSWTFNSDGSGVAAGVPGRTDDVVILNGHTITIDATNDNGSAGVSVDGLGRPNVGSFTESGSANFYHTGNITINSGGTLTSSSRLMLEGYTLIDGTLNSTQDVINLGRMTFSSGGTMTLGDDLILTGNSRTLLDDTPNSDDDLYIDHTEARLCGSGVMNIGVNSPNTPVIDYWNGATSDQICSGFSVTCGPDPGCSGFPVSGTGNFTFDLMDFGFFKYLTIKSSMVAGDLTNFPVLISFSDPDIRTTSDGGNVESANGYDIVFSSSNNCGELSQLDYQLEEYTSNGISGTIVAWVNVPFVSGSTDTEIYMYYGNSAQTEDLSSTATFDQDFVGVFHLHNSFVDGTAYGNDGSNTGTTDQNGSIIADGRRFSQNDYIETGVSGDMSNTIGTFSAWCFATSFSGNHQYIMGHSTTPVYNNRLQLYTNDASGDFDLGLGNDHNENTNIYDFNTNEWYHVALTWSAGGYLVYVNGNQEATGGYAGFTAYHTFLDIGNDGNAAARNEGWIGDLDEIRFSTTNRSANWIETEYTNQVLPDSFFTVGSELTNTCIALPVELVDFNALPINNTVHLNWSTLTEINNDYFTVERSTNLKDWHKVNVVNGAGNSQNHKSYSLIDKKPLSGTSYYRLRQTDYDGSSKIEKTVSVKFEIQNSHNLYPNPNDGSFTLEGSHIDPYSIVLYDLYGRNMDVEISNSGTTFFISVRNHQTGVFNLRFIENGEMKNLPLIVQ